MNYVNLTPHTINMNDGRAFEPSGTIARVSVNIKESSMGDGFYNQTYGEVEGLPAPKHDTLYIVSGLVMGATTRMDVIAPATSHKDVVRNDKGHIVSVSGFISKF